MASQCILNLKTITGKFRRQNSDVEWVTLGKTEHSGETFYVFYNIIHRPRVQEIPPGEFPCLEA